MISTNDISELTEESVVKRSARFLSHMNHVSVSPTDGTGPTQGQRKTLTRVGIEPTTFGLDLRRNLSFYLYMLIAVTLTSSVPTACSRLTL